VQLGRRRFVPQVADNLETAIGRRQRLVLVARVGGIDQKLQHFDGRALKALAEGKASCARKTLQLRDPPEQ
jgi:hypothetical protein